jgi:GNAT superfamily N-acetyltransferase
MSKNYRFEVLNENNIETVSMLGHQLNPTKQIEDIRILLAEMFSHETYRCFGLFLNDQLIGISSGWMSVRLYSGKQLEVDNVIVDDSERGKGHGKVFFDFIQKWAAENQCQTIELNTYVSNALSHKFYFNAGFSILGFHFWKKLPIAINH